jgi:hypothetical protein
MSVAYVAEVGSSRHVFLASATNAATVCASPGALLWLPLPQPTTHVRHASAAHTLDHLAVISGERTAVCGAAS